MILENSAKLDVEEDHAKYVIFIDVNTKLEKKQHNVNVRMSNASNYITAMCVEKAC